MTSEQKGGTHTIPIIRQSNDEEVFWAQAMHHRGRRLDWLEHLSTEGLDPEDIRHRRIQATDENMNWRSTKPATKGSRKLSNEDGVEVKFQISNCHHVLWTGDVGLGTPAQTFTVHIDTGGSDLWVASDLCGESCSEFVGQNRYKQNDSSSYKNLGDDSSGKFKYTFGNQEIVEGEYGQDTLSFGNNLKVQNTTFAQVTKFSSFKTCAGEQGVLGLGTSEKTTMKTWPSPISTLKSTLRHPMFALHLDAEKDDYAAGSVKAKSAHSELVLGGVNRKKYFGCLQWHPLGQFDAAGSTSNLNNYWNFKLSNTMIGDEKIDGSNIAVVDSGSTYVVGPSTEVGKFTEKNDALCFQLNENGDIDQNSQVDCYDANGFDIGVVPCKKEIDPLVFHANGQQFSLGKDELVMPVQTSHGTLCVLRLNGSATIPGWVLGDPFLSKFYAVFDFGGKRLGFARSARNSNDVCPSDTNLDLDSYHPDPDIISFNVTHEKPDTNTEVTSSHPLTTGKSTTVTEENSELGAGGIVGIIFGVLGFVGILFFAYRRHAKNTKKDNNENTAPPEGSPAQTDFI